MTASGNIEQEVLLIAGRSGSGKTSVSFEVSDQLQKADVAHCLVDGDNLDTAYPKPAGPQGIGLTEANLTALWRNYTAVGQHRLIYVNTVSVLEYEMIIRSLGGAARAIGVILTATDATVLARLANREVGGALERHLQRSSAMAVHLETTASRISRISTDGRTVVDVAKDVVEATGWSTAPAQ
ncbi:MAG TPA: adenylyl-sulfate kinase [Dermatophilaceae bacterium]